MAVLITGAASAAAFRIRRMLEFDEVIFADHLDLPQAIFKETRFINIPGGNSASYAHQLLKICLDNQIEFILPLRLVELRPLSEAKILFEEYGIKVVVPDTQALGQVPVSGKAGSDFIVLSDGMILGGKFMELLHFPSDTGIFSFETEDPSAATLFAID